MNRSLRNFLALSFLLILGSPASARKLSSPSASSKPRITVLLYNYAAGLMVYMITSSLWGIVEQRITKKILGPISPDAVQAGTMPMM